MIAAWRGWCRLHTRRAAREDGTITILTIGCMAIAVALVIAVASATSVHLQRKELANLADALAADAADQHSLADIYAGNGGSFSLSDAAVSASARDFLAHAPNAVAFNELTVLDASSPDGVRAHIELRARAHLPVLGPLLAGFGSGIDINAQADAYVQDR